MKDPLGHGSNSRGGPKRLAKPIPGHPYHQKSDAELRYIAKDAKEAAEAMRGHSPHAENKYLDQVNDAASVLGYRQRGGSQDLGPAAAEALASGQKSMPAPVHGGMSGNDRARLHDEYQREQASLSEHNKSRTANLDEFGRRKDGTVGRHGYNPESVSKAIANNRTGKIGAKEASAIHRLLRGRG